MNGICRRRHIYVPTACLFLALSIGNSTTLAQEPGRARPIETSPSSADTARQRDVALEQFIAGDVESALDTLNAVGEPRLEGVVIEGLVRTRQGTIGSYLGAESGELLTTPRLRLLRRRLDEFPAASKTLVRYDLKDDAAILRPIVFERSLLPEGPIDWAPVGARALFTQELRLSIANPLGYSEVWSPSVRWARGRPKVALRMDAPAPAWLPGVLSVETSWGREHYLIEGTPVANGVFEETRTRASAALADWLTHWLHWQGGGAIDHIGSTTYFGVDAAVNTRWIGDRLSATARASGYSSQAVDAFSTMEVNVSARSTVREDRQAVSGIVGYALASDRAPLATWPAASTGTGYTATLRAHRLYEEGLLVGDVFGRRLMFASGEYLRPIPTRFGSTSLKAAGFVDIAQARQRIDGLNSPWHVDVGGGLRFNTSRSGSQVRLDLGVGLRDGDVRLSAAYVQPWGER